MDVPDAELVRVFEADPALGARLDEATRRVAARQVVVDALRLPRGRVQTLLPGGHRHVTALLIVDGLMGRVVELAGRRSLQLLGAGDVVEPWDVDGDASSLEVGTCWRVLEPTRLAILDAQFTQLAGRLPGVIPELLSRPLRQAEALARRLAIAQVPRLDVRVLALMWDLADRWGQRERDTLYLPLRLSQGDLAELVCAQRTSVTLSLKRLRGLDLVHPVRREGWVLKADPPQQLESLSGRGADVVVVAEALIDAAHPTPVAAVVSSHEHDELVIDLRSDGASQDARRKTAAIDPDQMLSA
jgi:CRP-like cAMP-binding protein